MTLDPERAADVTLADPPAMMQPEAPRVNLAASIVDRIRAVFELNGGFEGA